MSRLAATHRWAVVLAGGEGSRLRPLTRTLAGDARPKQFCSIRGDRPLLDATLRRAVLPAGPGPHASRGGRRSAGEPRDRTGGSVCAPELALPDLYAAFEPVRRCVGTVGEAHELEVVYCSLATIDFSRSVLGARPANLAVLPVSGVQWSDRRPGQIISLPFLVGPG
jgi:hypothetical protein